MKCERCLDPEEYVLRIHWPNQGWKSQVDTPVCRECHEALHCLGIDHELVDAD